MTEVRAAATQTTLASLKSGKGRIPCRDMFGN